MTPEQLLQPRYEVIAPYPLMPYNVGDLLHRKNSNSILYEIINFSDVVYFDEEDIANHTHLFRRIEWWEKRKPEDMPEYLKHSDGEVEKVSNFFFISKECAYFKNSGRYWKLINTKPATLQDYTDYLTKTNQQ